MDTLVTFLHGAMTVSIQLVSPTSGERLVPLVISCLRYLSFHSISFPNEWGEQNFERAAGRAAGRVSIQLVSPTSGESLDPESIIAGCGQ